MPGELKSGTNPDRRDTSLVAVRDVRERVIASLSDLFARDEMEMDEFDRRVTLAHRGDTVAEIEQALADLPIPTSKAMVKAAPAPAMVPAGQVRKKQAIYNILGGSERTGQWTVPQELKVWAVMGGAVLDFREARLPAGVSTLRIRAILGGVHIIVPPSLAVDVNGSAVMGGFEHMERTSGAPDPDRPVLEVHGFAFMGGVHVETRLVGETEGDARRRRRRERKEQRKQLRGRDE